MSTKNLNGTTPKNKVASTPNSKLLSKKYIFVHHGKACTYTKQKLSLNIYVRALNSVIGNNFYFQLCVLNSYKIIISLEFHFVICT